jgi:predicted exporter
MVIILIIFISIFRSLLPVVLSMLAVFASLGMAVAAALLVFREMHIITFVFGTTLIGICVDYSIHFFVHWKGNGNLKDGFAIRAYISKSLIMAFISTEICFFAFLFAPFPILKQFAVFSMTGLLSAFLNSYCL